MIVITLARKPMAGTVAESILTEKTGALNIDASRIPAAGGNPSIGRRASYGNALAAGRQLNYDGLAGAKTYGCRPTVEAWAATAVFRPSEELGRWPANLVMSPEGAVDMDGQSGHQVSDGHARRNVAATGVHGIYGLRPPCTTAGPADEGGASRCFLRVGNIRHDPPEGE